MSHYSVIALLCFFAPLVRSERDSVPCQTHPDCYASFAEESDIPDWQAWLDAGCQCTKNNICQIEYQSGGMRGNWFNCYAKNEVVKASMNCSSHEDCYWNTTGTTVQQSDIDKWEDWLEAGCQCTDKQICQIEYKTGGARGNWFNCYKGKQPPPVLQKKIKLLSAKVELAVVPCQTHIECYASKFRNDDIADWEKWLESGCQCTEKGICQIQYQSSSNLGSRATCYAQEP